MVRNKYRAKPVIYDGLKFKSKKEGERYLYLKDDEMRGKIKELRCHTWHKIIDKNDKFNAAYYEDDFNYFRDGKFIIEDVKGYKKGVPYDLFTLKKKLMYDRYKIEVQEI